MTMARLELVETDAFQPDTVVLAKGLLRHCRMLNDGIEKSCQLRVLTDHNRSDLADRSAAKYVRGNRTSFDESLFKV